MQVAVAAGGRAVQAPGRGEDAEADDGGDGDHEEDDTVLQTELHLDLQHQPQRRDLRRDGVELLQEEELDCRDLQPLQQPRL